MRFASVSLANTFRGGSLAGDHQDAPDNAPYPANSRQAQLQDADDHIRQVLSQCAGNYRADSEKEKIHDAERDLQPPAIDQWRFEVLYFVPETSGQRQSVIFGFLGVMLCVGHFVCLDSANVHSCANLQSTGGYDEMLAAQHTMDFL
eukprot:TRINITY_DN42230_c0_g1_i1.p1 TRINITY_DN42230_c0_g1~~TRINITY_DN42230_c0_g1_i1.p1  ORF type:complete len:147 (-),score=8.99 TRINITY_DN42230_c0_g1_i1:30-470(-)